MSKLQFFEAQMSTIEANHQINIFEEKTHAWSNESQISDKFQRIQIFGFRISEKVENALKKSEVVLIMEKQLISLWPARKKEHYRAVSGSK